MNNVGLPRFELRPSASKADVLTVTQHSPILKYKALLVMWACTFGLPDTNSSPYIVGISGFEPKPAESESAVLTIILYIPIYCWATRK